MTFGEKFKKMRSDNGLTQDELANKLYVTRTAISKWERDKGFPNIDSLKLISKTFNVSLDELISDETIETNRLRENKIARKMYIVAMVFFGLTIILAILATIFDLLFLNIICSASALGYIVFALLSKPRYKRLESRKSIIPYVISRIVILVIIVIIGLVAWNI
ncbi:MAG: helix-turn-helix transcriptional regulator [Clostridia bacterium]|nr:helix-turn-helix transcriptional regulator [Clostridia bacterium]